jgi:hypothetical protein
MVIVVYVDLVAVPAPVAAVVDIVGRDNPVGAIVENYVSCPIVNGARHEYFADMPIVTVRVAAAGDNAIVVIVPTAIVVAHLALVPSLVSSVVVMIVAIVFVPSFVLAIIVAVVIVVLVATAFAMVIAVLGGRGDHQDASEGAHSCPQN